MVPKGVAWVAILSINSDKAVLMIRAKKICVVMPAYNAALTLEKTLAEIPMDIIDDIILVDDASK